MGIRLPSLHPPPSKSGQSAILIDGGEVSVQNLGIVATDDEIYGIRVVNDGNLTIDNTQSFDLSGAGSKELVSGDPELYDGKGNTAIILANDSGAESVILATNYTAYEGDTGEWYMPSIGELMQVFNIDINEMDNDYISTSGVDLAHRDMINNAIEKAGGTALKGSYWSSNEFNGPHNASLNLTTGYRDYSYKTSSKLNVRSFQIIEDCYDPVKTPANDAPKVGYIMYKDGTYSSAEKHNSADNDKAIGVITNVSGTGDVTIIALHNASETTITYGTSVTHVDGLTGYTRGALLNALKTKGNITISNTESTVVSFTAQKQFSNAISQYDSLINDGNYKGVNLLKSDSVSVCFNENGTSSLNVKGKDMTSSALGISPTDWFSKNDVIKSLYEIETALSQIRTFVGELGNNYSIISTRESFTENLVNILTSGSDELTLADMNEEATKMLVLQTRQQLAINALSLANQSNQSILKLF